MRLRYLYLPRCGPLSHTGVVFGREDLVTRTLDLPRKGALNFMVGVNGSGKSSLLRALYRIFLSLKRRERPDLQVTLAWDYTQGNESLTAFLFNSHIKTIPSLFATFNQAPMAARRQDWEAISSGLIQEKPHPWLVNVSRITGPETFSSPMLFARLPKRLIAYTSGADEPWEQIEQPLFHPAMEDEYSYESKDERPRAWTMEREWNTAQTSAITSMITPEFIEAFDDSSFSGLSPEAEERILEALGSVNFARKKISSNHMLLTKQDDFYTRIRPENLRHSGMILALWQTAKDLSDKTNESHMISYRTLLQQADESEPRFSDGRRVMNQIDLFWPTHLSITYYDHADDGVSERQHRELFCLLALADEVISHPLGQQQAVISLGPTNGVSLSGKLENIFPMGFPNQDIARIARRVDGCKTGAEAVLRIFSEDEQIDSTPMDVFSRLRDWERTGLLETITLTVKRLYQAETGDGGADDVIVTYDQLSDGEQMLLGRMGLIFLLRGQDGSLLLLDEPETHFNDVWKREIVEMLDMGLLNSTNANVVIATHTSIALTDAFAAEVTVLDKTQGGITARGVSGGLFGTDPGEVSMNLFRAESSIGRRSVDLLDQLLKTDWKNRENDLEAILDVLGSSFHRAELRAILKQLRENNSGSSSG